MQTFLIFLCRSTLIAAVLFLYYWLVLRNRRMHSFNRSYLLLLVPVSLVFPLLHFQWYTLAHAPSSTAISILQAISSAEEGDKVITGAANHFSVENFAWLAYCLVSLVLLVFTLSKVLWIYRLKRNNRVIRMQGYDLVYTDIGKAPFSFFNTIFWRDSIIPESESGRQILAHEITHIKQHHTVDKLFLQSAMIFFWANPIYWLVQKELSLVHEFIADESAIQDRDTGSFAMMLLQSHYGNISPYLVHPFFSSLIKRRLFMINQTNKTKYSFHRQLLVLPLLAAMFLLFSCAIDKKNTVYPAGQKLKLVLDAGHGGQDAGGSGNGFAEKDLNLVICNKIGSLARQYNIDVVQTRKDDSYPTLAQRVQLSNEVAADLFMSIHLNTIEPGREPMRYEVVVSAKTPKYAESRSLASAIMPKLQSAGVNPVMTERGVYVLKNSNIPSVVIECGNITNASDVAMVRDDQKLEAFCRNLLEGVVAYGNSTHK